MQGAPIGYRGHVAGVGRVCKDITHVAHRVAHRVHAPGLLLVEIVELGASCLHEEPPEHLRNLPALFPHVGGRPLDDRGDGLVAAEAQGLEGVRNVHRSREEEKMGGIGVGPEVHAPVPVVPGYPPLPGVVRDPLHFGQKFGPERPAPPLLLLLPGLWEGGEHEFEGLPPQLPVARQHPQDHLEPLGLGRGAAPWHGCYGCLVTDRCYPQLLRHRFRQQTMARHHVGRARRDPPLASLEERPAKLRHGPELVQLRLGVNGRHPPTRAVIHLGVVQQFLDECGHCLPRGRLAQTLDERAGDALDSVPHPRQPHRSRVQA
mmetsp:Transcript_33881/g.107591  ORF Transcript_33881/g.107591 Transcript_33881/m.107591 type:complete len:318 (+) Transcript_33881:2324-3277(+)